MQLSGKEKLLNWWCARERRIQGSFPTHAKRNGYDFHYYHLSGSAAGSEQHGLPQLTSSYEGGLRASTTGWRSRLSFTMDVCIMALLRAVSHMLKEERNGIRGWHRYAALRPFLLPEIRPKTDIEPGNVEAGCWHVRWGPRAPSWGKLLALGHAMEQGYDQIVYIDSDAIFVQPEVSVDDFLSGASVQPCAKATELTVLFNFPWTRSVEANAGFMIWQTSDLSRQMLEDWWDVDAGRYNLDTDWDQHGLNEYLLKDAGNNYRDHITVLPVVSMLERKDQYIRHVTSAHRRERVPRLRLGVKDNGIDRAAFAQLMRELASDHVISLDISIAR